MKKLLTLLLGVIFSMSIQAQTTLIQEGFETLPFKFTSSNTAGASHWNTSTSLKKSGAKSDSCSVISGLTTFLLSDTFNTDGKQFVLLEFSHIAKINYLDRAEIEISVNNGNWTKLTTAMYLGTSTNFTLYGDRFDSRSYSEWDFAHDSIVPNNTWWKTEIFNISSVAKDTNNIAIRFRLSDYTPAGAVGAYGWLIDDVKISASVNEIIPPSITYTAPIYQDSVFSTGPFNISANIIDASGISSAKLFYKVNGGPLDSIPMVLGVGE